MFAALSLDDSASDRPVPRNGAKKWKDAEASYPKISVSIIDDA